MKNPSKILSICIPTYNRGYVLKHSIDQLVCACACLKEHIEIIVSDNNSTDDTEQILAQYNNFSYIHYYKNSENIGFNDNMIKIIKNYISGKYCWLIGDDDFVYLDSIQYIISLLKSHEAIDYIYVKFDTQKLEDIISNIALDKRANDYGSSYFDIGNICKFEDVVSGETNAGNILLTFISSSIIKTSILMQIQNDSINRESWNGVKDLFPNAYFYSRVLKDCISFRFTKPLITAAIINKEWNNNLWLLRMKYLPELYDHYCSIGYNEEILLNSEKLIIQCGVRSLMTTDLSTWDIIKIKLRFIYRYRFNLYFYRCVFTTIYNGFNAYLIER